VTAAARFSGERKATESRARNRDAGRRILAGLVVVWLLATVFLPTTHAEPADLTRLIVLTDISSLTPGVAEPDDGQSLIRLMLYTNELEIEALIATSNLVHGRTTRPDLIRQVVEAYGEVRPNLLLHDRRYPTAEGLRQRIVSGQPHAGRSVPLDQSVGAGKVTEASEKIISVVDRPDPRPVWVVIWGGAADLAQALWTVRNTRAPHERDRFLSRLRVHFIDDQDSSAPWVREQFPSLWTITQRRAYRGMYRDGDISLVSSRWVQTHIHGHGRLGDLYPDYNGGDIWSSKVGRVRGIKEGDTPSFLSLVPNGLSDPDQPWLGSWGGRFDVEGKGLVDVADTDLNTSADLDYRMSSVYRWRPDFQADFQARLDWCIKPYAEANHPPIVRIAGPIVQTARPGDTVTLEASGTADPDGNALSYEWRVYPVAAGFVGQVKLEGSRTKSTRFVISSSLAGKTVPVLLAVTDRGTPSLTRYARVLITVGKPEP
jgi:hypothetical protein